jgi:hypothetical protein
MGYDITLHPIKAEEITHFLLDVIQNPELKTERSQELAAGDESHQNVLEATYGELLEAFANKHSQHIQH